MPLPPGKLPAPAGTPYPFVGNNYMQYGEVPGYIYNYYTDEYDRDPRMVQEIGEAQGYLEKKPEAPGLMEQVMPLALSAGAQQLGSYLGGSLGGLIGGGGGAAATTGAATGATAATGAATATGGATGAGGLLGAGSGAGAAGTTGATTAGSGMGAGLMAAAPYAGVVGGAYLLGNGINNYLKGKDSWDPKDDPKGAASRASLAIATGGLSEVARYFGVGRHKSTKQYQDERWGKLSDAAQGLKAANHPGNDDGVWKTGKYAGQEWSFDKAKDLAKEDPTHFVGVLGNLETFGDEYLGLDPEIQKQIVKQLVDEDLYKSDKGDILIGNKDRAKEIYNSIVNPVAQDENVITGVTPT